MINITIRRRRRTITRTVGSRGKNNNDNNKEEKRNTDNYKEKEHIERIRRRTRKMIRNIIRRRYDIEGCRACGRSSGAKTPASLLEFRSASFDVRVLD
eukprot:111221-Heterocapsa_arctica.AAC.1